MKRDREITIHTTIEVDVTVVCRVTPGVPGRGPDFNCAGGYPPEPGEVEILSIESEDGTNLNGVIDELSKADIRDIEEKAEEAAADAAGDDDDRAYEEWRDRERA